MPALALVSIYNLNSLDVVTTLSSDCVSPLDDTGVPDNEAPDDEAPVGADLAPKVACNHASCWAENGGATGSIVSDHPPR